MKKNKLFALCIACGLTAVLTVPALAAEVPADVAKDAWYYSAISYVCEKDMMDSMADGKFQPTTDIDRATVYQTLYKLSGNGEKGSSTFTDVAADAWYADAAAWAQKIGLAAGDNGAFGGERNVTRQELSAILYRYSKLNKLSSGMPAAAATFSDAAEIGSWATESVNWAAEKGLVSGRGEGKFAPQGTATRAEFAQILMGLTQMTPVYTETVVSIKNGDHEIPATICMPTAEGKFPAVVMLHGTGSNREEAGNGYAIAAPIMAENGIATVRIDFMGSGESTADYKGYTFDSAVSDAVAAAEYMQKLETVDAARIGVMGWSQGGTDALLSAGKSEIFKSVVTWAGAPDLSLLLTDEAYATAKTQGYFTMEFDWRTPLNVSLQWCEDVKNVDVLKVFSASKAPILAIQGATDDVVDPAWAQKIVDASGNEASAVHMIENCGHTFEVFSGSLEKLYDAVLAGCKFFNENM